MELDELVVEDLNGREIKNVVKFVRFFVVKDEKLFVL